MPTLSEQCARQEELLQFSSFSNDDALKLGLILLEEGKKFGAVAVEITVNGLTVFRHFPNGTKKENELWLNAKRNIVNVREKCSYRSFAEAEERGKQLVDWKLAPETDYALCGGGFPLRLKNGSMIGTICVSGLPHEQDHQVLLNGISKFLGVALV